MEVYEYKGDKSYSWIYNESSDTWEQETIYGLPLSAVTLADYADCYNCFQYNSKTQAYEATASGLLQISEIIKNSEVSDGFTDADYVLTECSFVMKDGHPYTMKMVMEADVSSPMASFNVKVVEDVNYTFSDFGTTKVEFPAQIQQWLKENGVDVDEPSKEDPVNPTPSGKLTEKEWVDIFTNEKTYENYTNYVYAEGEAVMYSSSGKVLDREGFIMNAFLYADGDKMHATMQDGADEEVEEIYLYRQGSTYHNWTKDLDKGGWEYDGANIPNTYRVSFINFNALARAYRYFDYNPLSDQYEANEKGLAALRASLFEDTLVKESVLSEITQWTEFSVRIQNGKIAAVYCTATFSETDGKNKMEMSFSMNMDFNDYNKTTVEFPREIQKQIDELGGSTQPVDPVKPSGKLTEKEWIKLFGNLSNNYTGELNVTIEGHTSQVQMSSEITGKVYVDGMKSLTSQKEIAEIYFVGEETRTSITNMVYCTYRLNDTMYTWTQFEDEQDWSRTETDNPGEMQDSYLPSDIAKLYRYFSYNSDTGIYEATKEGLRVLADAFVRDSGGTIDKVELNEYAFAFGEDSSVFMHLEMPLVANGVATTIRVDYRFFDIGYTKFTIPDEIQKQIDSIGGGSNLPVEPDKPDKPDNPDNPDDKPVVSEGTKGLEYSLNSDGKGYSVNGIGTAKGTVIVIPAEYNGLPVTEIRNNAFSYETITSVVIPEGVSTVGSRAFCGCGELESIVIAKSVTSIGSGAFRDCTSLTTVYYAGSATDWEAVNIGSSNSPLTKAEVYFYSTVKKTGNYWHYVADTPVKW